jgi:hypothetical protein
LRAGIIAGVTAFSPWRLSVAPMMDWTDRHCRHFHRLITRRALLYTEMVTTGALLHGDQPPTAVFCLNDFVLRALLEACERLQVRVPDDLEIASFNESELGPSLASRLHLIAQQPWLGWGWGELSFAHYVTLYDGPRFVEILDNAHNLPLHLAVELGIPAAVLICGGFAWLVLSARPWREPNSL